MSLRSGKLIKRYSWDDIPMTQEVIDRVLEFGEKENAPEGVIIHDGRGNVEHNDFEYDDIEGVYGYDLQRNLYPSNNNSGENSGENQIEDGDDSSYSDNSGSNDSEDDYLDDEFDDDDDYFDNDRVEIVREDNERREDKTK